MRNQVLPGDWMQHRDSGTAMLYYYNSLLRVRCPDTPLPVQVPRYGPASERRETF